MPYQAQADVTIPKVVGSRPVAGGKRVALKESVNYVRGAIVFEKDISPDVLSRLEEGDDHLSTLLTYVDPSEARAILDQQVQEFASQTTGEGEVLHQEERLGGNPTADPSVEVGDGPGYEPPVEEEEAPPAGDGSHVETADQTVGQGTEGTNAPDDKAQEVEEPEEKAQEPQEAADAVEENAEGESQSTGESETEASTETESSAEDQADGQADSVEAQTDEEAADASEPTTDKFDAMSHAELKDAAKDKKIKGRTTMSEDDLRDAVRKAS